MQKNASRHDNVQGIDAGRHGDGYRSMGDIEQPAAHPRTLTAHEKRQSRGWGGCNTNYVFAPAPAPGYRGPKHNQPLLQPCRKLLELEVDHGQAKCRTRRRAKHLGVIRPGVARQQYHSGRAQSVSGPDQRADVTGVLNRVHHENGATGVHRKIVNGPRAWLDDGKHSLRRVGVREIGQFRIGQLFDGDAIPLEPSPERGSPLGAGECRTHHRTLERDTGGHCFFDEPHTLGHGQVEAAARVAPL